MSREDYCDRHTWASVGVVAGTTASAASGSARTVRSGPQRRSTAPTNRRGTTPGWPSAEMAVSGALLTQVSVGAVALYALVNAAGRAIDRLLALAEHYDVDEVLVGMTVLALGTSLPELSAHLVASVGIVSGVLDYEVTSAVVLGGNMGSSTVQQFLLVGVLLIAYGHLPLSRSFVRESTCRCWARSA
ncbi:hypothetical protein ACFQH8_15910 [Halomicroarcula sp. GCM10025710]